MAETRTQRNPVDESPAGNVDLYRTYTPTGPPPYFSQQPPREARGARARTGQYTIQLYPTTAKNRSAANQNAKPLTITAFFGCERRCEGSLVYVCEVGGVVMMYLEAMAPISNSYSHLSSKLGWLYITISMYHLPARGVRAQGLDV